MHSPVDKQIQALGQRVLSNCAQKLGGVDALARHLGVPLALLQEWLEGRQPPPAALVLKAVSVLVEAARPLQQDPHTPANRGNPKGETPDA